MTFSFVANRKWVFRAPTGRRAPGQALRFVAVTLVGAYLIQAPLVGFLTPLVGPLAGRFSDAARVLPLHGVLVRPEFWARSIAFAVATGVSMCWTFLTYRHWVFRPSARQTGKPS